MRTGRQLRRAHVEETVREIFVRLAGPRRRSGAILIEDDDTHLLGIFTDSDLARLFEKRREADLDRPIGEIMTADPKRVRGRGLAQRCGRAHEGAQDQRASGRGPRQPSGGPDRRDRPDRPGARRVRGVIRMGQPSSADLTARCEPIELLVVDVDGVLTDGVIAVDDRGVETEAFSCAGRPGISRSGTARASNRPFSRAGGPRPSIGAPPSSRSPMWPRGWPRRRTHSAPCWPELGLEPRQVCFVGDDLLDLPVLRECRPGSLPRRCRRRGP